MYIYESDRQCGDNWVLGFHETRDEFLFWHINPSYLPRENITGGYGFWEGGGAEES